MIHISEKNTKMGLIPSFSLMPGVTCGDVPCKDKCYAMKIAKMRPSVRNAWRKNTDEARRGLFAVENQLNAWFTLHKTSMVFRIHVAGDFFSSAYLQMWMRVARRHPKVQFFCFTKSWNAVRNGIHNRHMKPANLTVILSAWLPKDGTGWLPPRDLLKRFPVAFVVDPKERQEQMIEIAKAIGTRRLVRMQECKGHCESCGLCFHRTKRDGDILFNLH